MSTRYETGNPEDAFIEAEAFYYASDTIMDKSREIPAMEYKRSFGPFYSALVCHSFATEMYLKCLSLAGSQKKFAVVHDLEFLFNELDKQMQDEIINNYNCKYYSFDEDCFDIAKKIKQKSLLELISESKLAFKLLRYGVTQDKLKPQYRLFWVTQSIRDIAINYVPESADLLLLK